MSHRWNLDHLRGRLDDVDERLRRIVDRVDVGQSLDVEVVVPRRDVDRQVDALAGQELPVVVLNDGQKVVLENL